VTFGATTRSRLVLFGGLYFAQGVPWGFVTVALVLRFSGLGLGPGEIGAIGATAAAPWALKFLLGPVVDALSTMLGRRRLPLLLLAIEGTMAATVLSLAVADPRRQWEVFLALVFTGSLWAAVQDVITDALAIALLPQAERARTNGVMTAAKYLGTMAGGYGLTWLAGALDWPATHAVAAGLLLLPAPAMLLLDQALATAPAGPTLRALPGELVRSFLSRSTLLAVPFLLVAGASDSFLYPLVMTRLRQGLALSNDTMAWLGFLAGTITAAGALLGGFLADRLGRRQTIVAGAMGLALSHLAFGLATPSPATLIIYQIGGGLSAGVLYAATLALCMDLTNPALPATHFQVFMALLNLRSTWASALGGRLAESVHPLTMFALAAAIELLPLGLLLALDARRAPRGELPSSA